jgi:hypothetical protein
MSRPAKEVRRLLIYLGIALSVVSVLGYFLSGGLKNAALKSFIEDFCSNSFGALVAFLAIAMLLENYEISWGQNSIEEAAELIGNQIDQEIDFKKIEPHTLMGLKEPEKRNLFQDFSVSRNSATGNVNAVSFLWADTLRGDSVRASIMEEDGGAFLRTWFDVHQDSWGCNLSIRPQNERPAYLKDSGLNFLTLHFRIPENGSQNADHLRSVGIAILVINGMLQHWQFAGRENQFIQKEVTSPSWQRIDIPLDPECCQWALFSSDGNRKFGNLEKPDFSIISSVIIKVGAFTSQRNELGAGKGIIDIGKIEFNVTSFSNI